MVVPPGVRAALATLLLASLSATAPVVAADEENVIERIERFLSEVNPSAPPQETVGKIEELITELTDPFTTWCWDFVPGEIKAPRVGLEESGNVEAEFGGYGRDEDSVEKDFVPGNYLVYQKGTSQMQCIL